MKIWDNIECITNGYILKFKPFRLFYEEESRNFLKESKIYGSPYSCQFSFRLESFLSNMSEI